MGVRVEERSLNVFETKCLRTMAAVMQIDMGSIRTMSELERGW